MWTKKTNPFSPSVTCGFTFCCSGCVSVRTRVNRRDLWKISLGWECIYTTAASRQHFIWKAPSCESSLLLLAHSTSLSPLQSSNYCMVNRFQESIISSAISVLYCSCYREERLGYCEYIDIRHFHGGNTLCLCHRMKVDINENSVSECRNTLTYWKIDHRSTRREEETGSWCSLDIWLLSQNLSHLMWTAKCSSFEGSCPQVPGVWDDDPPAAIFFTWLQARG